MNVKDASVEGSERKEGYVTGPWGKGDLCYTVADGMAELCPAAVWKAELVSNELAQVTQISKPIVEGAAWFLTEASSKMREKLRKELLKEMV